MDIIKIITLKSLTLKITEGVVKVMLLDGEELLDSMYEYENDTISFQDYMLGETVEIHIYSKSKNLIGYRGDTIYRYTGNENVLESSSLYTFDIDVKGHSRTIEFGSKFSPFYCKVRDVETLIKPIINTLKGYEEDLDIEYEIFYSSLDIDTHLLDEDTELEDEGLLYANKLAAFKTAYNIVYRYFYNLSEEVGAFEKQVATVSETRERRKLNLDDYLGRFERNIKIYEDLLLKDSSKGVASFVKAKNSTTGLNDRLWS